jgi:hypothetical protein
MDAVRFGFQAIGADAIIGPENTLSRFEGGKGSANVFCRNRFSEDETP